MASITKDGLGLRMADERRIKEIEEGIKRFEEKYGMSYEEFYEHIESRKL